ARPMYRGAQRGRARLGGADQQGVGEFVGDDGDGAGEGSRRTVGRAVRRSDGRTVGACGAGELFGEGAAAEAGAAGELATAAEEEVHRRRDVCRTGMLEADDGEQHSRRIELTVRPSDRPTDRRPDADVRRILLVYQVLRLDEPTE